MPGDFFAERTPEPTQYLNLMKSIWVLQKIKKGDEYAEALSDPLWELYVRELDEVSKLCNPKTRVCNNANTNNAELEMLARIPSLHCQRTTKG